MDWFIQPWVEDDRAVASLGGMIIQGRTRPENFGNDCDVDVGGQIVERRECFLRPHMQHAPESGKQIAGGKLNWDLSRSRGKSPVVLHRGDDVELNSLEALVRLAFDEDSS